MSQDLDFDGEELDEEDVLRADFFDFVGNLLTRAPDADRLAKIAALSGDEHEIGRSIRALAAVAAESDAPAVEQEFSALFIGLGRGEVSPYASYYLTGFLNEKPLAALRADMSRLGMSRATGVFEPEDNIASLLEMMAGLIRGRYGRPPADLETQAAFFNTHIGPWATPFFTDLEAAPSARFYKPVGALGRLLVEIEKEAFRLARLEKAGGPPN